MSKLPGTLERWFVMQLHIVRAAMHVGLLLPTTVPVQYQLDFKVTELEVLVIF